MKRLPLLFALALAPLVSSCLAQNIRQFTADEQSYIDAAALQPTAFALPTARSGEAWARAQTWLAQFSTQPLATVTEFVVATVPAESRSRECGYTVTRTPRGDSTDFVVRSDCDGPALSPASTAERAAFNARALALHIATGRAMPASLRD